MKDNTFKTKYSLHVLNFVKFYLIIENLFAFLISCLH